MFKLSRLCGWTRATLAPARFLLSLCFVSMVLYGDIAFAASASIPDTIGPFQLYFAQTGENPLSQFLPKADLNAGMTSTREFTPTEKDQIKLAMGYWAERAPSTGTPILIYTGFSAKPSGSAFASRPIDDVTGIIDKTNITPNGTIFDNFVLGKATPLAKVGMADNAIIFQVNYDVTPPRLLLNDNSVVSSMLHEMGHAMGIWGSSEVTNDTKGFSTTGVFSANSFTAWNNHLVDIFGVHATPGMAIEMITTGEGAKKDGIFQLYGDKNTTSNFKYPTFQGTNVNALTGGRGMPVMGGYPVSDGSNRSLLDGINSLGHPGIMNSIMSYGLIRNMPFTEMELAAFQDMGYSIDRSQFFGKSYYYDVGGDTQDNTLGLGSITANTFSPNMSTFGLGVHIMRDNLTLTQRADIFANGYGGGGVRIDGVGNTFILPKEYAVAADGLMGTGLLVSYGKNNVIKVDGLVSAMGSGGIGVHIGINAANDYIHSYTNHVPPDGTIEKKYEYAQVVQDLNGPLVKHLEVTGALAGRDASIFIAPDAHVEKITIHGGPVGSLIQGDIISRWSAQAADNTGYFTNLNFTGNGKTSYIYIESTIDGTPDQDFAYTSNLNRDRVNALKVSSENVTLRANGSAKVYSWDVGPDSRLEGNFKISTVGKMSNAGTISPGNSIGIGHIFGDFDNTGTLHMEFDGSGDTDQLLVSGTFNHDTTKGATVVVSPMKSYYRSGPIALSMATMFSGAANSTLPTKVDSFEPLSSPTLRMTFDAATSSIAVSRASNTYSQYAPTSSAAPAGRALGGLADSAEGDMQTLLTTLDFSSRDGSVISAALPQLTAAPFAQASQASAEANLHMGRMALSHLRTLGGPAATEARAAGDATGLAGGDRPSAWSAFVMPFGGTSQQQSYKGASGYGSSEAGLMGGFYHQTDNTTMSLYTAFSRRQLDMWTVAGAQARSLAVHAGGAALWHEKADQGWQLWGLAQLGLENTDMRRSVVIEEYARQNTSFYTSLNGVFTAGGGYLWRAGGLSLGPQMGLEYAFNALPSVEESGGGATRLAMEAHIRHDLRGIAGLMGAWNVDLGQGRALRAHLDAVWRQDLLPPARDIRTHFVGYSEYDFTSRTERNGQGSLGLAGGVQVNLRHDVTLSALVNADVLRPGYSNVGGGLSLRWEF